MKQITIFEAGLAYTLPIEKLPLSIAWNFMFAVKTKMKMETKTILLCGVEFSIHSEGRRSECNLWCSSDDAE